MKNSKLKLASNSIGKAAKARCNAKLQVNARVLASMRDMLSYNGFVELSGTTLGCITGFSKNPFYSAPINYVGADKSILHSSTLQLEATAAQLGKRCFTVSNSFKCRKGDSPSDTEFKNLYEVTYIEVQNIFADSSESVAFEKLIAMCEELIKHSINELFDYNYNDLLTLGCDLKELDTIRRKSFIKLSYESAIDLVCKKQSTSGEPTILDEEDRQKILEYFCNTPVVLMKPPIGNSIFTAKRIEDSQTSYSFDLLSPKAGRVVHAGGLQEENPDLMWDQFLSSDIAKQLKAANCEPNEMIQRFMKLHETGDQTLRGGFSLSYDRIIGFIMESPLEDSNLKDSSELDGHGRAELI